MQGRCKVLCAPIHFQRVGIVRRDANCWTIFLTRLTYSLEKQMLWGYTLPYVRRASTGKTTKGQLVFVFSVVLFKDLPIVGICRLFSKFPHVMSFLRRLVKRCCLRGGVTCESSSLSLCGAAAASEGGS